jgi:hypothetical protein
MAVVKNGHGMVKKQKNGLKMVNLLLFNLVYQKHVGFQKVTFCGSFGPQVNKKRSTFCFLLFFTLLSRVKKLIH